MRKVNITKKFIKLVTASVIAGACLVTSASAYLDIGDSVTYTVKSNSTTWDNKNNTWAWDLKNASTCVFKGTVTSGCSAYYALYQWTFNQSEKEAFKKTNRSTNFSLTSSGTLPEDDYFARVTYSSGGINNGTLTFSKKS